MKEKIIELREKGYSYSQIVEELGCSKSTVSKGGLNDLNNLGITCPEANMAKSSLLKEELISLCKEILEHNGFSVLKTG